jgi:CBS domain-containing protein
MMYDEPKSAVLAFEIMRPDTTSVAPETDIADAVNLMLAHKAGALPVIDSSGVLLGMVTASGLISRVAGRLAEQSSHWLSALLFPGALARRFARLHGRQVSEILDTSLGGIGLDTPVERIVQRFHETDAERLAVVDRGEVVGVVIRADVLGTLAELYRPKSGTGVDSDIREQIVAELARKPWMPRQGVQVSVRNGVADLEGIVLNSDVRPGITAVVENVPGVKAVQNHLRLVSTGPVGVYFAPEDVDSWEVGPRK